MTDEMQKEVQESIAKATESALKEHVPAVVKDAVDTQVQAAIKEAGIEKSVPVQGEPVKDTKSSKERAAKFFQALYRKDFAALQGLGTKALTEGTDADGGYLVPEEVNTMIDYAADNYGLIRKLARRIPMSREVMNMPTVGTKPTVSWPGEATNATESQPVFGNVALTAKTAVGLTPISNELLADANQDVVKMLTELFGEQLAGAEDEQGLAGSGSPFTGVLNDGGVTSVAAAAATAVASLTIADLEEIVAGQKVTLLPGSVFVFHPAVWSAIKTIQEGSQSVIAFGSTNSITMKTEGGNLVPAGFLLGYPVYLSDKMPAAPTTGQSYGIFGNFSKFYFGDRQQITVDISSEATIGSLNLFQANSSAIRVKERVALAVGVGEAFVVSDLA